MIWKNFISVDPLRPGPGPRKICAAWRPVHALVSAFLFTAPIFASAAPIASPLNSTSNLNSNLSAGEMLARAAGCVLCHSSEDGPALAGGRALSTPYGLIYSPNISPDREHGIGTWTFAEFDRAVRTGIAPAGHYYFPAFPYPSFRLLSAADVRAIFDYLQTQPAQSQRNRPDELHWPFNQRALLGLWRALHFKEGEFVPDATQSTRWNRGAYLVQAVSHCGECHSPRDALGGVRQRYALTGARLGSGHYAPNLSPHPKALAAWSEIDLADYLATGRSDYTRRARDEMRESIEGASRYLSAEDRLAIAEYLLSSPARSAPVANRRGPRN